MRALAVTLSMLVAACSTSPAPPTAAATAPLDWRSIATPTDRERLRGWRQAFAEARQAAISGGHAQAVAREGALLQADAALGGPVPNGIFRCRVIKLGAKSDGLLDYVAYPAFTCRITQEGAVQRLAKLTGSQRQVGLIYPGDAMRQVFLGTLVLGDEQSAMRYGTDETRNVAGYVERIGPVRWRLIMPRPHFESRLDVLELVPSANGVR